MRQVSFASWIVPAIVPLISFAQYHSTVTKETTSRGLWPPTSWLSSTISVFESSTISAFERLSWTIHWLIQSEYFWCFLHQGENGLETLENNTKYSCRGRSSVQNKSWILLVLFIWVNYLTTPVTLPVGNVSTWLNIYYPTLASISITIILAIMGAWQHHPTHKCDTEQCHRHLNARALKSKWKVQNTFPGITSYLP